MLRVGVVVGPSIVAVVVVYPTIAVVVVLVVVVAVRACSMCWTGQ